MSKYRYLETGTVFSADELQDRFAPLTGPDAGLNTLDTESFALGCFRHNLVPRMIHSSEVTADTLPSITAERNGDFSSTASTEAGETIICEVDFGDSAFEIGMGQDQQNVGAVIVLANVVVEEFDVEWELDADAKEGSSAAERARALFSPNEDVCWGDFFIEIETTSGPIILERTRRSLSPRVTIAVDTPNFTGLNTSNEDTNKDGRTHQDVAIRAVVRSADIPEGDKLQKVRFRALPGTPHVDMVKNQLVYSKANLTALPLHADAT
jgi:hypothetical protein